MHSALYNHLFDQLNWLTLPAYAAPSHWTSHTAFAMYLVFQTRPGLFVELGTEHGMSYCAFCQAITTADIQARAYAVDTWQGDLHIGSYGSDVLAMLQEEHQKYQTFSTLLQMTFNEAVDHFEDSTIDLLHIDGTHTYEAVRQDFETWLPKLSNRAIVLFHDTNEHQQDFGVWRFWAELQTQYPG